MTVIDFPALKDVEGQLSERRKTLAAVFTEAGPEMDFSKVKSLTGDTYEIAAEVRKLNDELDDLGKKHDDLKGTLKAAQRAKVATDKTSNAESGDGGNQSAREHAVKSVGEMFTESEAFTGKSGSIGPVSRLEITLKTVMDSNILGTGSGWVPETLRTGRVIEKATRPIQLIDLIPQTTTGQAAVVYMEETTFTNNAAEVLESIQGTPGTYPESALQLTERTSPVRKIAVFIPLTDEQLEDVDQVRGYVNNRLPFMVRQRLDTQILAGNGTSPNLQGLNTLSGIQTQAKGGDPTPDAVYKAMVNVQVVGRAMPDATVFHPTDWQNIRLLRTADGIYIWGNPSDSGPERIWGLQVTKSDALSAGTAFVGAFQDYSELSVRRGLDVQVSNSHSTFFVEGKQAMRADMRAALIFYRPAAFCKVTGL